MTGMRWGELLALRWHDINLDGASITIRRPVGRPDPGQGPGCLGY
jgi:integrase